MSLTNEPEAPPAVPAVNHVRQIPANHLNISEPDQEGTRVLTIGTPMPDSFVLILPAPYVESLKEKLNGGVILATPGDVPKAPAQ